MNLLEISRRRFLQGSIALCVYTTSSYASKPLLVHLPQKTSSTANNSQDIPYLCNMCRNKCAGFARVEDKIVTKLNPNKYFPKSRNMLCPKGNAGIDALYDTDRLKYPLIRIGKKGDGRYKKVTWDEANEYIKDKLVKILDQQKDNRSTIAYCNGEGFNKDEYISFFGDKLGSSNFLDEGSICLNTKLGAEVLTLGNTTEPDIAGSDFVIIVGANRYESLITPDSIDLIKTDKYIVVIDPRVTITAQKANQYIPINPGTDLALCLAMIYISFEEKLYNKEFVKEYFVDFDKLYKHIISSKYTANWASSKTNINKETILKLTKQFFSAKNPPFYLGRRSVWAKNDFQLRKAMIILNGLVGNINKQGGLIIADMFKIPKEEVNVPFYANSQSRFDLDGIVYGSKKGGSWLNFRDKVINKTSPYPIKAMFIRKHNIMHNLPNIAKTKQMLKMMDLVVVFDTMPNDTAMFADVILPECTYLEREDLVVSFNRLEPSLALRNQVIKPLYESKSMQDILSTLGHKLSKPLFEISKKHDKELQENIKELGEKEVFENDGYRLDELYQKNISTRNKELITKTFGLEAYNSLKTKGVWYPNMDKFHKKLFNNFYEYYPNKQKYNLLSSKKFKIKCYLKKLQDNGFDPMPTWQDEYDFKPKEDKFRIITGRYTVFTQSATTNNKMLRDLISTNHIWINDKIAKKLDIKLDDMVAVKSSIGEIKILAYPTNKIHPQVVWLSHGFNSQNKAMSNSYNIGANDNEIIEDKFEKIYGCAIMHDTDVTIRKI